MTGVALVVARSDDGVIGDRGRIPWRLSEDLRHFRQLTWGKPCIMGRKTWASLPVKPLPGRINIVVTRDRGFSADGALVAFAVEDALRLAQCGEPSEIMVIGGTEIYREAIPYAERVYLTEVHGDFCGDARLEPFPGDLWQEEERQDYRGSRDLSYSFVRLTRRNRPRSFVAGRS
jgi:dihydrofolate reductase